MRETWSTTRRASSAPRAVRPSPSSAEHRAALAEQRRAAPRAVRPSPSSAEHRAALAEERRAAPRAVRPSPSSAEQRREPCGPRRAAPSSAGPRRVAPSCGGCLQFIMFYPARGKRTALASLGLALLCGRSRSRPAAPPRARCLWSKPSASAIAMSGVENVTASRASHIMSIGCRKESGGVPF